MTELLAPAGNIDAFKAAIAGGCDAIYLGMQKFGARAYSCNFDLESLRECIEYAHLRDVKIYVTMNTIVFEDEIDEMQAQLRQLNEIGVDGIIVQDLAVFDYVEKNFEDMEVHCSTQMGIDDLDGTMLLKDMGADRVVLARETSIDDVKNIKKVAKIPIEVFVHGALCMSYSGNCLMSGLIGYRSGNRGRCVGSCRKPYELINTTTGRSLGTSYILSTKDLNTVERIDELRSVDSLKIEGRMKEAAYVSNVVAKYRQALDGTATAEDKDNLKKTFNRTFTEGYMFGEDPRDIANIDRPNNYGYEIGHIGRNVRGMYEIILDDVLNQNDVIRIDHGGEDVNLSVVKLYDHKGDLINSSDDRCFIKIKEQLSKGDVVYKTKDYHYYKLIEREPEDEFKRFPLDIRVYAYPESNLIVDATGFGMNYVYEGDEVLSEARNNPTNRDQVIKQFARLNDTVFELGDVEFEECNAFIPAKMMNAARREIATHLYQMKLNSQPRRVKTPEAQAPITFANKAPYLTAYVRTQDQYDACVAAGIQEIYVEDENVVRRNQIKYEPKEGQLLIGGYGGINYYKDTNEFVTDYSLNVVNSTSCYELHKLGAKRITVSYEINKKQLDDMLAEYRRVNGGDPCLEMIVYGRAPLLFTKYCPLKKMDLCGQCRKCQFELKDEHGTFPVQTNDDCTTVILNGKILNLLDEMPTIEGVEAFRLNFSIESGAEAARVIKMAQGKLSGRYDKPVFNQNTDTRGHFNKEIM
ncbi:MAG: U32 family peptidase [Eubacterium sp.]|nr:U32 family peptidase [Candidatus Colimonas fimequi]